jgi:hypothetical protein
VNRRRECRSDRWAARRRASDQLALTRPESCQEEAEDEDKEEDEDDD